MSILTRVKQKIFGSTGDASEFGKIGSKAAGSPVTTKDLATIQSLSQFLDGLFAITASAVQPPRIEDINALYLLITSQLAYLFQNGIPEWDPDTDYYNGISFVQVAGVVYQAIAGTTGTPNTGNNPTTSPTDWKNVDPATISAAVDTVNTALTAEIARAEAAESAISAELITMTGAVLPYAGISAPSGFLMCDGSAVSRTTYATLWAAMSQSKGTVVITIASPAVVFLTAHGLSTGDNIELTTTGSLPTGLSPNTNYFVIRIDANNFNLATSYAGALVGTKITTTGSQSGVHTLRYTPFGVSGGSDFLLPDLRGTSPKGVGTSNGYTQAETIALGSKYDDELQGHVHQNVLNNNGQQSVNAGGSVNPYGYNGTSGQGDPIADSHGNGTPRTGNVTRGKGLGLNHIIKT